VSVTVACANQFPIHYSNSTNQIETLPEFLVRGQKLN